MARAFEGWKTQRFSLSHRNSAARTGVFDRSPGYQENIQLFEFLTQGRCEIALWEALSGALNEVTFRRTLISDENPTCPVILEKPGTIDQPT